MGSAEGVDVGGDMDRKAGMDGAGGADYALGRAMLGALVRQLRTSNAISQRDLAAGAGCAPSYIAQLERGGLTPDLDKLESLGTALGAREQLAAVWQPLDVARRERRSQPPTDPSPLRLSNQAHTPCTGSREDDMHRRALLQQALGMAGAAGLAGPFAHIEAVRRTLEDALERSVGDWEAAAWRYGHDLATVPPLELLNDLTADALAVRRLLDRTLPERERTALYRVTAQLSWFIADRLGGLGEFTSARRWFRTAIAAADRSGDNALRVWVLGRRATSMSLASPHVAVATSDEALAVADQHGVTSVGRVAALQGRAQALSALGRPEAADLVNELHGAFDLLPESLKDDRGSAYGWTESELLYVQSLVYSRMGDRRATQAHQAVLQASASKAPVSQAGRTKIQLQRAGWLVRSDDVTEGLRQATDAIDRLPPEWRIDDVMDHAHDVEQALPSAARASKEATEYRELLAAAAAPSE